MDTLIFSASPKKEGNSANLAKNLHTCLSLSSRVLFLEDYSINPCIDCGYCKKNKDLKNTFCSLDLKNDDTKILFTEFSKARNIYFVSPIYFYHLPSQFKALIDRSQRYWYKLEENLDKENSEENFVKTKKNIFALFIAGRKQGEKLSQGAELTLKYFAPLIGGELKQSLCLYGLENPQDYINSQEAQDKVLEFLKSSSINF